MKIHSSVLLLPLLAALLFAEEKPAPKPKADEKPTTKFDDGSKKLFENWRKVEYRWKGVKQATCKLTATIVGQMGKMDTKALYKYDGKESSLEYEPGAAGAAFMQQGWDKSSFDGHWKDGWDDMLAGGTFTATETDAGTTVKVEGETKSNIQAMHFDEAGVLTKMKFLAGGGAQGMTAVYEPKYKKLDDGKYLTVGYDIEVDIPGMGKYVEKMVFTHKLVGKLHVLVKAEATAQIGGQPAGGKSMAFEWDFGDKSEAAAPSEK